MFYLKKYFTEGLIQVAILLSLCGIRVDLGLDPYLSQSWQDRVLGPTSALTQTQFHNLHNHLDHLGYRDNAKTSELEAFFTTRRLLGGLHSLDRLQIPDAELETWLVQREPDGVLTGPGGPSDPQRQLAGLDREPAGPGLSTEDGEQHLLLSHPPNQEGGRHGPQHQEVALHGEEEEEEKEEEPARICHSEEERSDAGGGRRREGAEGGLWRREGGYDHATEREAVPAEAAQDWCSLQEGLQLVQGAQASTRETQLPAPPTLRSIPPCSDPCSPPEGVCVSRLCEEGQVVGRGTEDVDCPGPDRELFLHGWTSLDQERHWQDLLDLMETQDMGVPPAAPGFSSPSDRNKTRDAEASGSLQDSSSTVSTAGPEAQQDFSLKEADLVQDFLGPLSQSEPPVALLPLMPSAELDVHQPDSNSLYGPQSPTPDPLHAANLLAADPSLDFSLGLDTENEADPFSLSLLTPHPADDTTPRPPSLLHLPLSGVPPVFAPTPPELRADLSVSLCPFLVDEDEVAEEDGSEGGVPSPLGDFLEDDAMLEEISLFDLALEEGFSPEMGTRFEEEGFLDPLYDSFGSRMAENSEERDETPSCSRIEAQGYSRRHRQADEEEADSDSGLSVDFSHSPASPCASETSCYTSSSSSSSSSGSAVEDLFPQEEDENMEQVVTVKQEEQEEVMGAVGGNHPTDIRHIYWAPQVVKCLPCQEHVDHNHTYNQPRSSPCPPPGRTPNSLSASPQQQHSRTKPCQRSSSKDVPEAKLSARDERQLSSMRIPFSTQLIVNLPVEEFNELLASHRLNGEQLTLVKDIRRRGKNKMAAQNCRRRKMDTLLRLEGDVSRLRHRRVRLLRERREVLTSLGDMKHQLDILYQDVLSSLRDEEGGGADTAQELGANGGVTLTSHRQGGALPWSDSRTNKKPRDKRK